VINDAILSYYCEPISSGGPQEREYLRDHIKSALSFLEEATCYRAHFLAKRFTAHVEFEELLRIAVVLHDAGKAFYQDRKVDLRENRERNIRYLSFAGHEYISAAIADAIAFNLSELKGKPLYDPVTFAVLHHHHAMTRRVKLIPKLRRKMLQMPSPEYQESLSKLKEVLRQFLPDLRDAFERSLPSSAYMLTESICPMYHKIYERFVQRWDPAQKKLAFLLLNSLIACDYLAAKSRGGRSSHFQIAVDEFVNSWLRIFKPGHPRGST
jgi:CRISPR-associated endonuclease Cas3-HD